MTSVAHGGGTDDDPRHALFQPALDGAEITNSSTKLHRHGDSLQHCLDGQRVDRLAGKGTVEVDDVQVLESLCRKGARLRRRIEIEHGGA